MKLIMIIVVSIILRIILLPIFLIFRVKKNRVVFINVDRPYYENGGYAFEYFRKDEKLDVYFLTKKRNIVNKEEIIYYPSFKAIKLLITAKVIIQDSGSFFLTNVFAFRALKVQLWHGNGMKAIGDLEKGKNSFFRKFILIIVGKRYKYDLVYFTSKFAYENRKGAFKFKSYKINGQPRNDLLNEVINYQENNILYAPTWRSNFKIYDNIDLDDLNKFLFEYNLNLYIKFHPFEKVDNLSIESYSNIVILNNEYNTYDILPKINLLITDYSSLYFDYLILNRPMIFYLIDGNNYLENERDILYNYEEITPGKKVYNILELKAEIKKILIDKNDLFEDDRRNVLNKFYDNIDFNSRKRLKKDIIELLNL